MGVITISDLDAAARAALEERARLNGRPVAEEARLVLERGLGEDTTGAAHRKRPSEIVAGRRDEIRLAVSRYRLENARFFGSILSGADTVDSDLDILVDARPDASLMDIGGLQQELEDMLGLRIDLLTPQDLPLRIREKVLAEAEPI